MKKQNITLLILIVSLCVATALAEDQPSSNDSDNTISTENITNISENILSTQINQTNISSNESLPSNETPTILTALTGYNITSFIPKEFKIGDVQLNIQVQNTGTTELKNIMAFISGSGFSSYEIVPIDSLKPGEKSYILVTGNFREEGNITLTIRINERVFYQDVKVIDPTSSANQQELKKLQENEERKKASLAVLSAQLEELNANYIKLENEFETKKRNKYDVSAVNLDDLKKFLRNAQSSLIVGNVEDTNASLIVALSEYADQKARLERSPIIKESLAASLKNKALIISTIAGAILASFALYELLKRKKDELYHKIKEVKIDKSTKITIEKKDEAGQKEKTKTKEKEDIGKEQKKEQSEEKQEAKKEENA